MATTLATIRAAVQIALGIDTGGTVWTDAELDSAIQQALLNLSRAVPRERTATVATVADNRDLDVSAYADVIAIRAVELPTGNHPRDFRRFELHADTLRFLDDPVPDGSNCKLFYDDVHVINGTDTLPAKYDDVLVLGACWKACAAKGALTPGTVNTGGGGAPGSYGAAAKRFERMYLDERPSKVTRRRFYAPHEPTSRQDSDPGP